MSIEGYIQALENMCEELKGRAHEIIGDGTNRLYSVDIRLHLVTNECPTYDVSCTYYPSKIQLVGE